MPYKYILFDLDGTLTDSVEGIINSMVYALEKCNLEIPAREILTSRVGPPLNETFRFFGVPEGEEMNAINIYREYYAAKGIYENRVYDGIPEQLEMLKKKGKTLVVATSKPQLFARRIIEKFELSRYFDFVAGSNMNETRTAKAEVITYALESVEAKPYERAVMVGDRKHDILGARQTGIASAGVLYGYGGREEIENEKPDIIIPKVGDIYQKLITA